MKKYSLSEIKDFGFLRIAGAIPELAVADISFNLDQYLEMITLAKTAQIDLLVFPDFSLTGISCDDLFHQDILLERTKASIQILRQHLQDSHLRIIFTIPERINHKLVKMLYIISAKENHRLLLPVLNTSLLKDFYKIKDGDLESDGFDYELSSESTILVPECGKQKAFYLGLYQSLEDFQINYGKKASPCHLNIILSEEAEIANQSHLIEQELAALSQLTKSALLYVSPPFGESTTDFVYSGRGYIYEAGCRLAKSSLYESDLMIADIDLDVIKNNKTFISDNYGDYYALAKKDIAEGELSDAEIYDIDLYRSFSPSPFLPADQNRHPEFFESVLTAAAHALAKRLKHIKDSRIILGLSGGSDSTLALLIAIRAEKILGQSNRQILCVSMPGFGTTSRTYDNTKNLASACGAEYLEIRIHNAVSQHFEDIGQDPNNHDVTYENAQARERTQILMDLANQRGGIVLGTGDLSESALGFATYGGDHLSMYHVNAGIPKTLLRHLIRYESERYGEKAESSSLNQLFSKSLVDILNTPVSPELLPPKDGEIAQITEDIVGPYELHDYFLYYFYKYQFKPSKILFMAEQAFANTYDQTTILYWLQLFIKRFFNNQFKRSAMPDGPSVLDVSLSPRKGLAMPSDANAKIWLEDLENIKLEP